ncbi:hypothetical protein ACF1BK_08745 [Streptomyces globisporus]|uniref:hypothetical protein n=1 Tax=Streptomyces globisporus TaxID=1908 RepID=UPI0036FDFDB9
MTTEPRTFPPRALRDVKATYARQASCPSFFAQVVADFEPWEPGVEFEVAVTCAVALKDGAPSPGFGAVNSPGLLRSAYLGGRTVIQKTTAGMVGALAVKEASLVLCDVTFVVTGEDGRAEEDLACAQYIAGRATGAGADATAFVRRAAESRAATELTEGVREGAHRDDVALCLEVDRFPFAMVATMEHALMVLRPRGVSASTGGTSA